MVADEESYARWIYKPRYVDEEGIYNTSFITLRENEDGVSGQLIDRAGKKLVILSGMRYRRSKKDGTPKEEKFLGFAKALSGEIRKVAVEPDKIDVIIRESAVPYHAVITFQIEGELIRGNTQNSHFLLYKDKLKDLLIKDVYSATAEELLEAKAEIDRENNI